MTKYSKENSIVEVPKKKITLEGLKNDLKLYRYIRPYRIEYAWGIAKRILLKQIG